MYRAATAALLAPARDAGTALGAAVVAHGLLDVWTWGLEIFGGRRINLISCMLGVRCVVVLLS